MESIEILEQRVKETETKAKTIIKDLQNYVSNKDSIYKVVITRTALDSMESSQTYTMTHPEVNDEGSLVVIKDIKQIIYINKSVLVSIQIQPQ